MTSNTVMVTDESGIPVELSLDRNIDVETAKLLKSGTQVSVLDSAGKVHKFQSIPEDFSTT